MAQNGHRTLHLQLTAARSAIASQNGDERRFGPKVGSHNADRRPPFRSGGLFYEVIAMKLKARRPLCLDRRAERALRRAGRLIRESRRLLTRSAHLRAHWQEDKFGECEMAERPPCPVCGCSEVTRIPHDSLSLPTEPRVLAYRCANGHRFLAPETAEGEARKFAA